MQNTTAQKKQRQKGFTLVEMLVTVAIMSIVLVMTVQLSDAFFRRYRMTEARWKSQNAAQRVMQYFEMRSEALNNSAGISLFYTDTDRHPQPSTQDPNLPGVVMQGVPDTGNKTYAYIYCQKDPARPDLGTLIYVLERGEGKRPVSLTKYLLDDDIPLDISFNVSTAPVAVHREGSPDAPSYEYSGGEDAYLRTTVDVIISTPQSIGGNYQLKTSFTMNNMTKNQSINYEGGDITPVSDNLKDEMGIAGWNNPELNKKGLCPVAKSKHPYAQNPANILRYVSTESFLQSQNTNGADIDVQGAGLCFSVLSMQGSAVELQVKGALRDFRDNVLSKTELGNCIIDKYYNEWSPALVSAAAEHPALLKVGKCVLIPASLIALFAAD